MTVLPPSLPSPRVIHPTESEVCNLEATVRADQEVGGLDVAVHDVVAVEVGHAPKQHQHVALDVRNGQGVL